MAGEFSLAEIIQQFNDAGNNETVKSNEQVQRGEQIVATVEIAAHGGHESVSESAPFVAAAQIVKVQGSEIKRDTVENTSTPLLDQPKNLHPAYNAFLEPPMYMSRETATVRGYQQNTDVGSFTLPTFDSEPVTETLYEAPVFTLSEVGVGAISDFAPQVQTEPSVLIEPQVASLSIEGETEATSPEEYEEVETFSPQHEMIIGIIAELVDDEMPKNYDYLSPEFLHYSEATVKKINLLEKAPTVEECRELLLEIRQKLRALLQLLGCSDVERTVTKLMSDLRNVERIKRYIEVLLQMAVYSGASTTRSQIYAMTHPRCHRVGQWAVSKVTGGVKVIHSRWDGPSASGSVLQIRYR